MSFMCATSKVNDCLKNDCLKMLHFSILVMWVWMRCVDVVQNRIHGDTRFSLRSHNATLNWVCFVCVFLSFSKAHWYQFSDTVGVGGVTRHTDIVNSWVSHTTTLSNTHVLVLVSCVGGLEGKNVVSQLLHESLLMWLSSTSSLSSCLVLEA